MTLGEDFNLAATERAVTADLPSSRTSSKQASIISYLVNLFFGGMIFLSDTFVAQHLFLYLYLNKFSNEKQEKTSLIAGYSNLLESIKSNSKRPYSCLSPCSSAA